MYTRSLRFKGKEELRTAVGRFGISGEAQVFLSVICIMHAVVYIESVYM
jgi:hypothetical protein